MHQWVHKYGEKSRDNVKRILLPADYQNYFQKIIEKGAVSDMLIESNTPGTGKTTLIHALAKDLNVELLFICASVDGGVSLREVIRKFATSASMFSDSKMPKVVALDEADGLTTVMQQGLRNIMDEFAGTCNFWLTCNYKHKIIDPLKDSRLQQFDFNMAKYRDEMVPKVVQRCTGILKHEGIPFEQEVVEKFVSFGYPNIRNIINSLDQFAMMHGVIDSRIINFNTVDSELLDIIMTKNFGNIRKFVFEKGYDFHVVYRFIYDNLIPKLSIKCIPTVIHIIREGIRDNALDGVDGEIIFADVMIQIIQNMIPKETA